MGLVGTETCESVEIRSDVHLYFIGCDLTVKRPLSTELAIGDGRNVKIDAGDASDAGNHWNLGPEKPILTVGGI